MLSYRTACVSCSVGISAANVLGQKTVFAPLPEAARDDPTLLSRYTMLQDAIFLTWGLFWSWALWLLVLAIRAKRQGFPAVWSAPTTCVKFLEMQKIESHPI